MDNTHGHPAGVCWNISRFKSRKEKKNNSSKFIKNTQQLN
jgi:hypothetical protein